MAGPDREHQHQVWSTGQYVEGSWIKNKQASALDRIPTQLSTPIFTAHSVLSILQHRADYYNHDQGCLALGRKTIGLGQSKIYWEAEDVSQVVEGLSTAQGPGFYLQHHMSQMRWHVPILSALGKCHWGLRSSTSSARTHYTHGQSGICQILQYQLALQPWTLFESVKWSHSPCTSSYQ